MTLGVIGGSIARVEKDRRRRIGAAEGRIVAHIGPQPPGARLALRQNWHGRIVVMCAGAGEDVIANEVVKRAQQGSAQNLPKIVL